VSKVLSEYLVVEKVNLLESIHTSQIFIDEFQVCKVVETNEHTDLQIDEHILVGNKIFFDPATLLSDELFFIYEEQVYGVIRDGQLTPREDFVYIKADKDRKEVVDYGDGLKLFNDTTYNPLATDNVVQDGEVFTVCKKAKGSFFGEELKIEVEPGDHVYTHHFLTHEDAEREFGDHKYYETRYENLYCKVSEGQITMLNNWNFVSPVEDELEITDSGIQLEFKQKNKLRVGIIEHSYPSLVAKGINVGDMVFFKQGREYNIEVEGKYYYRIHTNDIIYKIK